MILTCYNTFNTIEFKSKISGIDEKHVRNKRTYEKG
ncbi:hypothetical protein ACVXZ0_15875 [Staphylococcus aureus]